MIVREIDNLDELTEFETAWSDLLRQTPEANFFQSLDWLRVYWRHYGANQRLRVLLLEQGGPVVGILPLVRRCENTKVGKFCYLTYPLDYWGSFYGPIGPRPFEVLAAGVDYLKEVGIEDNLLELRWIGDENGQCEHANQILEIAGFQSTRSSLDSTAVIDLPSTWDEYLASRTGKWRNNYRRWQRKLSELGDVSYERFRPESSDKNPGWHYFEECLRIASASWQGSSKTGTTLTHEAVAKFLQDVHEAAANAGCVDINLLLLDGQAVAFAYNYVYLGHVYGLRVGYDANVPCKGIGNLLYAMTIEDSIRRSDWRYDMGPRHIEVKKSLMTRELPTYRLSCYRNSSMRQQLMRLKRYWDNKQLDKSVIVSDATDVNAHSSAPIA